MAKGSAVQGRCWWTHMGWVRMVPLMHGNCAVPVGAHASKLWNKIKARSEIKPPPDCAKQLQLAHLQITSACPCMKEDRDRCARMDNAGSPLGGKNRILDATNSSCTHLSVPQHAAFWETAHLYRSQMDAFPSVTNVKEFVYYYS